MSAPLTHEPRFGCRWGLLQEADVTPENAPIMCEDDHGPYVLYAHFERLQQQLAETQDRVRKLEHVIDEVTEAWSRSWDCSRDPGHSRMYDAVAHAEHALTPPTEEQP